QARTPAREAEAAERVRRRGSHEDGADAGDDRDDERVAEPGPEQRVAERVEVRRADRREEPVRAGEGAALAQRGGEHVDEGEAGEDDADDADDVPPAELAEVPPEGHPPVRDLAARGVDRDRGPRGTGTGRGGHVSGCPPGRACDGTRAPRWWR